MAYYRLRVTGSRGNGNETAHTITIEDDRGPEVLAQVLVETGYLQTTRISVVRREVAEQQEMILFRDHVIYMTPEANLQNAD